MAKTTHTIAVDCGNGYTSAYRALKTPKYVSFPSLRATSTADSFGLAGLEAEYETYRWNNTRYAVGDDIHFTRQTPQTHQGRNRYGNEMHQFLVAVAVAQTGVKNGTVDLTLLAPPSYYNTVKAAMQDAFNAEGGEVILQLDSERKPRKWTYSTVRVMPEGVAALCCYWFDDRGKSQGEHMNLFRGRVLVIDIGMHTTDIVIVEDGKLAVESLTTASYPDFGVYQKVIKPIVQNVRGDTGLNITLHDVDHALRNGIDSGDYTLSYGKHQIDLANAMQHHAAKHGAEIADAILDTEYSGLSDVARVLVVGGGSAYMDGYLRKWYKGVTDFLDIEGDTGISVIDANARGAMRLALMQQRAE